MPSLESDIIGQVARLPLRPSEANALLPLYEAISNGLHAIQDRFGDDGFDAQGRVDIEVLRQSDEEGASVAGFRITDNGIGLNEDNYKSFRTPFSQLKMKKGGKGVGRLGWLKVFSDLHIDSTYLDDGDLKNRKFNFVLAEKEQISPDPSEASVKDESGTTITMKKFIDPYGNMIPAKTDTIIQRIIGHFLPVFAGGRSVKIFLHDDGVHDLQDVFNQKIRHSAEDLVDVEINGSVQPILVRHMRCDKSIRPRGGQNNWMCLCANDRGVKEYGIDEQIGLKLLDGEEIYVGTVTGDYLDSHVNPQRTDFIFEPDEGRAIRRQVSSSIRGFLSDFIDQSLAQKKAITTEIIRKNPQYLYIAGEIDGFVEGLQPNSNNEEAIYVELSQNRFRRQRKFIGVKRDIVEAPNFNAAVVAKVEEYKKYIQDD